MLGRRRDGELAPATWAVVETSHDDQPLVIRFDARYRDDKRARKGRPVRIGVALPFTEEFRPDDRAQLDAIEDTVERLSGEGARLVLVLTTPQMREMVLHSATGEWIPQFHKNLRHSLPKHDVQVMAEHDPNWSVYFQFAANA